MDGKGKRKKGSRAENELFKLLSDELGFVVKRNLSQTRGGGADCIEIPGWSVECKRQEKINFNSWWVQTVGQAINEGKKPVLFYRLNYGQWTAVMPLVCANGKGFNKVVDAHMHVSMSLETACYIIRESL